MLPATSPLLFAILLHLCEALSIVKLGIDIEKIDRLQNAGHRLSETMSIWKDQRALWKCKAVLDANNEFEYAEEPDLSRRPLALSFRLFPNIPGGNKPEWAAIDPNVPSSWDFTVYAIESEVVAWKLIACPANVVFFCDLLFDVLDFGGVVPTAEAFGSTKDSGKLMCEWFTRK